MEFEEFEFKLSSLWVRKGDSSRIKWKGNVRRLEPSTREVVKRKQTKKLSAWFWEQQSVETGEKNKVNYIYKLKRLINPATNIKPI
jgi:hypothetical protein